MSITTTFPGIRDSVVYPFCYEIDHHIFRHIEFVSMWSANVVTMSCLEIHAYLQILPVLMRKDFWYVLVLHFLIMYLLTLLVEDLVHLPYLPTSGRTEEFMVNVCKFSALKKFTAKGAGYGLVTTSNPVGNIMFVQ